MITAYPLTWPDGWKRTMKNFHKEGKFSSKSYSGNKQPITVAQATDRVLRELERMGIDLQDVIVSTNVRTRLDGRPRSGEREPDDGGAAVYWQECTGERRVMAIDLYGTVADNLAAVAATLDAMRAIERHGGAAILERAFTGFTALPAPDEGSCWWTILGVPRNSSSEQIRSAFRKLANERHPDKGGTDAAMAELNVAFEQAQKEIG